MENKINAMSNKIAEVLAKRGAFEDYLEDIELTKAQHGQAIVELEEELAGHKEAFAMADDLGAAKLLKQQISSTEEEIELVKQVNKAKIATMFEILGDLAESYFACHTEAITLFRELDNEMVVNTGLGVLAENRSIMEGFATTLNSSFSQVRNILLDTGIVAQADQNKRFRGKYHLGQRGLISELITFESKVRAYVSELKAKGVSL
ncbi:hypothetical protein [Robertmurraya korlensis]|uniref:hypothetical protein n=1 Tax=Robertmurraya korlensis TaxID=519977 RepID=UPI00082418C7|nr:hypothetical protein [Robertmurraya korlensis]